MFEPQDMVLFAAVARAGGIRGAAAELGVPKSTISRRLAQLEASIGAPLVVRTSRRFALTDLGRALASRGEQMESFVRASEDLVRQAIAEPAGQLRIVAAPLIGEELFAPILAEVLIRHPRLSIEVRLSADFVDLRKERVDLAIRTGPLEDATDLYAKKISASITGLYASPKYLGARGVPETLEDLKNHNLIFVGGAPKPQWTFRDQTTIALQPRLKVDSFPLARASALEGAGIARMARFYAEPYTFNGQLVPVLERYWPQVTLYAVHAGARGPSPKVRTFLNLLEERVRARFPA
jgi:DNA-binding transcriptional LysR family regulator